MGTSDAISGVRQRIREAQQQAGLSNYALARAAGIAATTLDRRFASPSGLNLFELEAICRATGADFGWLMTGSAIEPMAVAS